ncbi:hypothetical protein VPH35_119091 [Triticum aestivum]
MTQLYEIQQKWAKPFVRQMTVHEAEFDRESDESCQEKRTRIVSDFSIHASCRSTHICGLRCLVYKVTMSDDGKWFECECGQFAHMRMLCCHALKVMDYVGEGNNHGGIIAG